MPERAPLVTTVRALLAYRELTVADAAAKLGISKSAMYERMSGTSEFKASEVAALADILGVSVGVLYDGLGVAS